MREGIGEEKTLTTHVGGNGEALRDQRCVQGRPDRFKEDNWDWQGRVCKSEFRWWKSIDDEVVSFDERMCHMEERNRGLSCSVLFGGTSSRFGVENDAIFWSGCLLEIDRNPICFLLSR